MSEITEPCSFISSVKHPVGNLLCFIKESVCYIWEEHKLPLIAVMGVVAAIKVHKTIKRRQRREKWRAAGVNVAVLHAYNPGRTVPNISGYILKLETYFRMAGIKYVYDREEPIGSKGKSPWITLNGEDYADSQLIMEFLGKKFGHDFSSHLTNEQKAAGRALAIMTDEYTVWALAHWRILMDPDLKLFDLVRLPPYFTILFRHFRHVIITRMKAQGIGLHSNQEIEEIMRKNIHATSLYLGNKRFLMGDEPCEADCSVFGLMAQFVWALPGSPYETMVKSEYKNIADYCYRMKEKFWPDWEQCLDK